MPNLCVVCKRYLAGGGLTGSMALIGSSRMDFRRLIPILDYFAARLGQSMSGKRQEGTNMSEETKVPGTQAGETEAAPQAETAEASQPDAAPETSAQAEPAAEAPQPDGKKPEQGKQKKDWFGGKTAKELEATKAKLEAAEKKAGDLRDQLLRTAAEYDNYRKRSAREADQKFNDGVLPRGSARSWESWTRWTWPPTPPAPTTTTKKAS